MNKYHNIPTIVDGIRFASNKEARRYQELKLLEKVGEISDLELQPSFTFPFQYSADIPSGVMGNPVRTEFLRYPSGRAVKYVADFTYLEVSDHAIINGEKHYTMIVEDVKGIQTPVFKLKAALMLAVHGIKVRIT